MKPRIHKKWHGIYVPEDTYAKLDTMTVPIKAGRLRRLPIWAVIDDLIEYKEAHPDAERD